jgi:hypothetical protein
MTTPEGQQIECHNGPPGSAFSVEIIDFKGIIPSAAPEGRRNV